MSARRTTGRSPARDIRLVRAIVHEAGNLLAAVRLSGHFLGRDLSARDRHSMSRDVELLASQAGALLAQIRPLLVGSSDRRGHVPVASLLQGIGGVVEGGVAEGRLQVASGRGLPDVLVDADAVHQLLVLLVSSALAETMPSGRVRVTARLEGRRVLLAVADGGPHLERPGSRQTGRGRSLFIAVADAVLRESGGRLRLAPRRRGNQLELLLPTTPASRARKRKPARGR